MRLKKVSLKGFKSFAERASVDFSEGITAIVGPNGCGKSNIIDAFRWAMGEQSARAVRGERMSDLIFSGTEKRKSLSLAEVTVHFSNDQGLLPVATSEVSITRRLYRDGGADYMINNAPARLKDIESMFLDTGLGRDAFAVFEQGKMDYIIACSPEERRAVLEEAAGIARFKQRKKEALRKLELTEVNLVRLNDIARLAEEKRGHLQEQSVRAEEYKAMQIQLAGLEKALAQAEIDALVVKWQNLERQTKAIEEQLAAKRAEMSTVDLAAAEKSVEEKHTSLQVALTARLEAANALSLLEQQLRWATSELKKREERLRSLAHEQQQLKETAARAEKERLQCKEQLEKLEIAQVSAQIEKLSVEKERLAETQSKLWAEVERQRQEHLVFLEKKRGLEQQQMSLEYARKNARESLERLEKQLEELRKQTATLDEESRQLETADVEQKIATAQELLARLKEELELSSSACRAASERQQALLTRASELQGKMRALESLKAGHHGFSAGAKKLLQSAEIKVKPLSDFLKVAKEHAPYMLRFQQTLVVENDEELERVLAFIRNNNLSDIALFCRSGRDLQQHFLSAAPSLGNDGFWTDDKGVIQIPEKGQASTFSRHEELKELFEENQRVELEKAQATAALSEAKEKQSAVQERIKAQDKVVIELEMHLKNRQMQAKQLVVKKAQIEEQLRRVEQQLQAQKKTLQESEERLERLQEELAQFMSQSVAGEDSAQKGQLESVQRELTQVSAQIRESKEQESRIRAQSAQLQRNLLLQESALMEAQARSKAVEHALAEEESKQEEVPTSSIEQNIAAAREKLQQSQGVEESSGVDLEMTQAAWKQLQAHVEAMQSEIAEIAGREQKVQLECVEIDGARKILLQQYEERFGPYEKGEELPSRRQLKGDLEKLREAMEALGPINFSAAQEYEDLKVEQNVQRQEIEDLEKAKAELLQIIDTLGTESRQRFITTFEAVRGHFQKNFTTLFGGGFADLQLIGHEDPLEAGVEIIASPPGKSTKALSLMSGGERCMTALAMLFALFEVKPSPFCLLDEVDAPLDEANVERFAKMMAQFVDRTQFIIITHNKNTMAVADQLLGVSAEEKGVTKVVPLELT